ncbi:MAG: NAD(P)/FAD-dependent oxidoreductase [Lachnospiraceae bacterium]|nr:NAD(P)/FAD-dependent oxidoreductase [Lachnospiraceae bacterium]
MSHVIVIGGGAAGMMAAIAAAKNGNSVKLLEKNEKLGKKIYITGKGRCNLTNACETRELFGNVTVNSKFLHSAFEGFDNEETIRFFNSIGLKTKVERGQRVFPESDKSSDVISVLKNELQRLKVEVSLNAEAESVEALGDKHLVTYFSGIENKKKTEECDACIVATGGLSYPSTGSTGDGYRFAKSFGHTVTPLIPSLVALVTKEDVSDIAGLALKNVSITLENEKGKTIYKETGEMLFTHTGISGPLILSASAYFAEALRYEKPVPRLFLDLKPGMSLDELDSRIRKDFEKELNKDFGNSLDMLLPKSLIPKIVALSGTDPSKKVNSVTKEERRKLAETLKRTEFHITGTGGYPEAVITKGGINVKEIDPKTMGSKLSPGLYFAGEVLDVDAFTGGFNLQIAWSTGYAAGQAIH